MYNKICLSNQYKLLFFNSNDYSFKDNEVTITQFYCLILNRTIILI
ncbi:hypothetical protein A1OE_764 [Candidatus Endolissoclinum faulkneri L2]|uniref:Uncharacterized protein n=1 Tax=Candidatus Endolissoclinum faulkneri L2 TaxID=1193729 RepID=K7YR08_9PROT|nr:hypothetical protein A1OE_764 [Candidatus Endolissoclinum faulkneri L2]